MFTFLKLLIKNLFKNQANKKKKPRDESLKRRSDNKENKQTNAEYRQAGTSSGVKAEEKDAGHRDVRHQEPALKDEKPGNGPAALSANAKAAAAAADRKTDEKGSTSGTAEKVGAPAENGRTDGYVIIRSDHRESVKIVASGAERADDKAEPDHDTTRTEKGSPAQKKPGTEEASKTEELSGNTGPCESTAESVMPGKEVPGTDGAHVNLTEQPVIESGAADEGSRAEEDGEQSGTGDEKTEEKSAAAAETPAPNESESPDTEESATPADRDQGQPDDLSENGNTSTDGNSSTARMGQQAADLLTPAVLKETRFALSVPEAKNTGLVPAAAEEHHLRLAVAGKGELAITASNHAAAIAAAFSSGGLVPGTDRMETDETGPAGEHDTVDAEAGISEEPGTPADAGADSEEEALREAGSPDQKATEEGAASEETKGTKSTEEDSAPEESAPEESEESAPEESGEAEVATEETKSTEEDGASEEPEEESASDEPEETASEESEEPVSNESEEAGAAIEETEATEGTEDDSASDGPEEPAPEEPEEAEVTESTEDDSVPDEPEEVASDEPVGTASEEIASDEPEEEGTATEATETTESIEDDSASYEPEESASEESEEAEATTEETESTEEDSASEEPAEAASDEPEETASYELEESASEEPEEVNASQETAGPDSEEPRPESGDIDNHNSGDTGKPADKRREKTAYVVSDQPAAVVRFPGTDEDSRMMNALLEGFEKSRILCAIPVRDEQYELLLKHFRNSYESICLTEKRVRTDILMTIAMVQIAVRRYDGGFWNHVSEELGLGRGVTVWEQSILGDSATRTLVAYGKAIVQDGGNVDNILMHSFITDPFADGYFNYLEQFYERDCARSLSDDCEEEAAYICECMKNPYSKRWNLISNYAGLSVQCDYDYCRNTVIASLKAIDSAFWKTKEPVEIPGRLQRAFEKWSLKSEEESGGADKAESDRKTWKRMYHEPDMECDLENASFRIVLPAQMILESGTPIFQRDIFWKVNVPTDHVFHCRIQEGYSGFRTREISYPIDSRWIFRDMSFQLCEGEQVLRSFRWHDRKVCLFDEDGEAVDPENLKPGDCFGYTEPETDIESTALTATPYMRGGLKFYEFSFREGDFLNVPGDKAYYCGTFPKTGISVLHRVPGVQIRSAEEGYIDAYSEYPVIVIDMSPDQFEGTAIYINRQIHKFSGMHFVKVSSGRSSEQVYYLLDTRDLPDIRQGFNRITVDYPGTTRKVEVVFFYIPGFQYTFIDSPYIFAKSGCLQTTGNIRDGVIYGPFNGNIQTFTKGRRAFVFNLAEIDSDKLNLKIALANGTHDICLDIPALFYSFDNLHWSSSRKEDIWYQELPDILYIRYPSDEITLGITDDQGIERKYRYAKNSSGIFVCELTRLKSYITRNQIIRNILFEAEVPEHREVCLLRVITRSIMTGARYDYDRDHSCLCIYPDIVGSGTYYLDVCDELSRSVADKAPLTDGKVDIPVPRRSCKLRVTGYEAAYGADEFEEDESGEEAEFGNDDEFEDEFEEGDAFEDESESGQPEISGRDDQGSRTADYRYEPIGETTISFLSPRNLTGARAMVVSLMDTADGQMLPLNYDYYIVVEKKTNAFTYEGKMFSSIRGRQKVTGGSDIELTLLDPADIHKVEILFYDKDSKEKMAYTYDRTACCLEEHKNWNYTVAEQKTRYKPMYPGQGLFTISIVDRDKRKESLGGEWLKEHPHNPARRTSIWRT